MISIRDVGTCRHLNVSAPSQVSAPFQVLTHASTSQFANKKVHMINTRDVGTCRHLDVSARVGTLPGVGTFSGADTCQHIPVCKQKVHMISIRDVGTCRHLHVSALSQVSAPFQVLTHASTSQFANKKSI